MGWAPRPPAGEVENFLRKDEKKKQVFVFHKPVPGAKTAVTRYKTLQRRGELALVEVELLTGRTHQIRAMEMAISAEDQSVEMSVDGTAEVTMNPYAARMTMNMDMLGMALKDVQVYMVSENGQVVAYTGMDMTGAGQEPVV